MDAAEFHGLREAGAVRTVWSAHVRDGASDAWVRHRRAPGITYGMVLLDHRLDYGGGRRVTGDGHGAGAISTGGVE
jgi:hypothetical protein